MQCLWHSITSKRSNIREITGDDFHSLSGRKYSPLSFSFPLMIIQTFVWRSPKGHCYGNQLNMGDVRKRRVERPLLFASAFDNRFI